MSRELEPWGGFDTPYVFPALENANRAATGALVDLYNEGRERRRRGTTGPRGD